MMMTERQRKFREKYLSEISPWYHGLVHVVVITMIGHYMVYETFHFCCHVKDNWFVRNMPFVNTVRRHHAAHHNMGIMMHCNMNLTFPVADWAMGTSDLRRGLLGHLFNGYDETHVKEELKPVMARFFSEVEGYDEMIVMNDIRFESHCEHHMVPIIGKVHIGYLPKHRVVGI